MIGKSLDFLSIALKRWGSELALIIIVCFLISLLSPAINLAVFGNDPYQTNSQTEEVTRSSGKPIKANELSLEKQVFNEVFTGTYLFEELLETLGSFDYEGGITFDHELDLKVQLVLWLIWRWVLIGLVWFLLVLPYILCGLVNVFTSKSDGNSGLVAFFHIKLSQYIRMIGTMVLITIRTFIATAFLFAFCYTVSVIVFGRLELWIIFSVGLYAMVYHSARFMLAPFYVMNTDYSPGKCLVLSWNRSAKYFWTLFTFSIFPLGFGVLPLLMSSHSFGGSQIIFTLAITFTVILIVPIADKELKLNILIDQKS